MTLNKIQIIFIIILIPLGALYLYTESKGYSLTDFFRDREYIMHIDEIPIHVEIADTHVARVQGLSDRDSIGDADGLLFIFPQPGFHSIWMKDMRFPIDIIWIDEDLVVAGIEKNVLPETYPESFRPPRPVKYVLETEIHYADTFDITAGQKVRLPSIYLEK